MTPARCRSFPSESDALDAVRRLVAAGVPQAAIRILMGEHVRDGARAPVGGFAGQGERVGAFAGAPHAHADAMGIFAAGPASGRRGGFADRDRDTVAELEGGVEHVRAASHAEVRRLLLDAGVDPAHADSDVEALHAGRVLVLVSGGTAAAAAARALGDA